MADLANIYPGARVMCSRAPAGGWTVFLAYEDGRRDDRALHEPFDQVLEAWEYAVQTAVKLRLRFNGLGVRWKPLDELAALECQADAAAIGELLAARAIEEAGGDRDTAMEALADAIALLMIEGPDTIFVPVPQNDDGNGPDAA